MADPGRLIWRLPHCRCASSAASKEPPLSENKMNGGFCTIEVCVGDITQQFDVDVVANAANSLLRHGSGVARALRIAGGQVFLDSCQNSIENHGPIDVGDARLTAAGALPNKMVVHAVGPRWLEHSDDGSVELDLLHSCVFRSLELASANGASSIALPAIASGKFGLPVAECARVLFDAALEFLDEQHHGAKAQRSRHVRTAVAHSFSTKFTHLMHRIVRSSAKLEADAESGLSKDGVLHRIVFVNFDDETCDVFRDECRRRQYQSKKK